MTSSRSILAILTGERLFAEPFSSGPWHMLIVSVADHSEPTEKSDHQGRNEGPGCDKMAYVAFSVDSFPRAMRVETGDVLPRVRGHDESITLEFHRVDTYRTVALGGQGSL